MGSQQPAARKGETHVMLSCASRARIIMVPDVFPTLAVRRVAVIALHLQLLR
jgi:hypothetical protein